MVNVRAEPLFTRVFRYEQANAQPIVGHADQVRRIRQRAERHPGLLFAGAAYEGVGIPDCVRQANDAAAIVLRSGNRWFRVMTESAQIVGVSNIE